jgi:hypothetical protein
MMKKLSGAFVALAPLSAFATVDVSDITSLGTDIATVGAAVLAILVAIKGIKLIRRAL